MSTAPTLTTSPPPPPARMRRRKSYWHGATRRLARDPLALICAAILAVIILSAIFAPFVAPADPFRTSMIRRLLPPLSPGYPLGTDELGRDMLSRLIYGGRLSLFMGFAPVIGATLIGGMLGVVAGFVGGRVNTLIMRVTDVFYAFPSVLLAVAISGALGVGIVNGLIALTAVFIPPIVRVSESVTAQVRNRDFVEAARATGANGPQIVVSHILPNVVAPILIYASSLVSVSVVTASGLSFLGLGASPPLAEWGLMLSTLRQAVYVAPLISIMPGLMIFATSVAMNLLSDSLRAAMDVRA